MSKIIKNIVTTLSGEDVGDLTVTWSMEHSRVIPAAQHPDNISTNTEELREVSAIHSIVFQLFNTVGINVTNKIKQNKTLLNTLESKLLDAVQYDSLEDIQSQKLVA